MLPQSATPVVALTRDELQYLLSLNAFASPLGGLPPNVARAHARMLASIEPSTLTLPASAEIQAALGVVSTFCEAATAEAKRMFAARN